MPNSIQLDFFVHSLVKEEQKFEPIVAYLKRILLSYNQEIGNMDKEIVVVLRKKPTVQLKEASNDISKMRLGKSERINGALSFNNEHARMFRSACFPYQKSIFILHHVLTMFWG